MNAAPTVYVETSIPSYYYEVRTEPKFVAWRRATRRWWQEYRGDYRCVSSLAVLNELNAGDFESREAAIGLLHGLPLLDPDRRVEEAVAAHIAHRVMPNDPLGDALHLAFASVHRCQFLLTWNCKHIANANKFDHIARVNTMMHLPTPYLVTPFQLMPTNEA